MGNPPREIPMGCVSNVSTPPKTVEITKNPKKWGMETLWAAATVPCQCISTEQCGVALFTGISDIMSKESSQNSLAIQTYSRSKSVSRIWDAAKLGRGRHGHYLLDKGVRFANKHKTIDRSVGWGESPITKGFARGFNLLNPRATKVGGQCTSNS